MVRRIGDDAHEGDGRSLNRKGAARERQQPGEARGKEQRDERQQPPESRHPRADRLGDPSERRKPDAVKRPVTVAKVTAHEGNSRSLFRMTTDRKVA